MSASLCRRHHPRWRRRPDETISRTVAGTSLSSDGRCGTNPSRHLAWNRSGASPKSRTVPAEGSILEIADDRGSAEPDESLQLLQSFIEQLDGFDRALIILYLDGNSYDTIAEVLGISETNVGTKVSRIKQKLRNLAGTA